MKYYYIKEKFTLKLKKWYNVGILFLLETALSRNTRTVLVEALLNVPVLSVTVWTVYIEWFETDDSRLVAET